MFDHSIPVPRLYKAASKIAKQVNEGVGSVKQLVYEGKHPNIKALYALVVQTLQQSTYIDYLLKKSKLLEKESRLDPWLAKILITELLWGKKRLSGEAKPIKTILAYEQIFKAHTSDAFNTHKKKEQVDKPRYVRINTIKMSTQEAIDAFRDEGWILGRIQNKLDYNAFLDKINNLQSEEFLVDIHIPNLLIFPCRTEFYNHFAYKEGIISLQDKASCLPVHILNPPPGSVVLDMCAAPGMKTTQAAAMMNNKGIIYAAEIDLKRHKILNKMIENSGVTCVKTINRDVLTLTEKECPGVEYILVDPSCSGSGICDRIELGERKKDAERLAKLAGFQILMLRHALTAFPNAKRIVYSTCSLYPEENEDVARQVLETCTKFKLVPAKQFVNEAWINFGSSEYGDIGNYCIYAKPEEDLTNGFFVAIFERLQDGEKNQFINKELYKMRNKTNRKSKKEKTIKPDIEQNEINSNIIEKELDEQNYLIENEEEKTQQMYDDCGNMVLKKRKKEMIYGKTVNSDAPSTTEMRSKQQDNDQIENTVPKKKKKNVNKKADNSGAPLRIDTKNEYHSNAELESMVAKKKKKRKNVDMKSGNSDVASRTESKNELQNDDELGNLVQKKKNRKNVDKKTGNLDAPSRIEIENEHQHGDLVPKKKQKRNIDICDAALRIETKNKNQNGNECKNMVPKKKKKNKVVK